MTVGGVKVLVFINTQKAGEIEEIQHVDDEPNKPIGSY
tara:strand:- start:183 stop:296 length:114 start_codon:yes stop_codon:yes gene_type:complete